MTSKNQNTLPRPTNALAYLRGVSEAKVRRCTLKNHPDLQSGCAVGVFSVSYRVVSLSRPPLL